MLIEVKETHPPKAGRKTGSVIAMDGQKFDCWPDKLAGIQVGRRYEIETSSRDYNGRTYTSITKAAPVAGEASRESGVQAAAPSSFTPEQEFVRDILVAYIGNGRCDPEKLKEIVGFIRNAYNLHWGPIPYRQAAE